MAGRVMTKKRPAKLIINENEKLDYSEYASLIFSEGSRSDRWQTYILVTMATVCVLLILYYFMTKRKSWKTDNRE